MRLFCRSILLCWVCAYTEYIGETITANHEKATDDRGDEIAAEDEIATMRRVSVKYSRSTLGVRPL